MLAQDFSSKGSHLGVRLTPMSADRASALKLDEPRGVEVQVVEAESPAAKAGIHVGDVLLTYNGEEILSPQQLGRLVGETPPGRKIKVQFWRDGKSHAAVVIPEANEVRAGDPSTPVLDARALQIGDIPRPLVVWENVALGIECEPLDSQLAEFFGVPTGGILIRQVAKGMVGDRAGLKAGDVIRSVDTRAVAAPKDLISYLRTRNEPGRALVIQIMRNHKPSTMTISLQ
jgi:serine protease Do